MLSPASGFWSTFSLGMGGSVLSARDQQQMDPWKYNKN